jgi:hypothetical protein
VGQLRSGALAPKLESLGDQRRIIKPPKLTEAERPERFVAMAKEFSASEDLPDFDGAFERVTKPKASIPSA